MKAAALTIGMVAASLAAVCLGMAAYPLVRWAIDRRGVEA